eukprot:1019752_1
MVRGVVVILEMVMQALRADVYFIYSEITTTDPSSAPTTGPSSATTDPSGYPSRNPTHAPSANPTPSSMSTLSPARSPTIVAPYRSPDPTMSPITETTKPKKK